MAITRTTGAAITRPSVDASSAPPRALRSTAPTIAHAIELLEAATQLELEEIERIHELAQNLETQMHRNAALLATLRTALSNVENQAPREGASDPSVVEVDDGDLREALRAAPTGLAPRELRKELGIPHTVSGTQLSRALTSALARGTVARSGKGPGTRYHLDPASRRGT